MNGATEATLAELLATANAMNVNLVKLNQLFTQTRSMPGGGGGLGSNTAAASLSALSKAANVATGALAGLANIASSLVSTVFSALASIVGKVVNLFEETAAGLLNFSRIAMTGNGKLSDLFKSFGNLPFFIGEVMSVFAKLISVAEEYLVTYRQLTKVGAAFGGNLFEMSNMAARAHLTLSEFMGVILKNSDVMATFGGGVDNGIKKFSSTLSKLTSAESPLGKAMLGLGYSAQETAEALASYSRSQGTMTKKGMDNTNMIAAGVVAYAKELDTLTKLTGKNREAIEAEVNKIQAEETYQRFLATLDPKEAEKIKTAVANMLTLGGRDAAEQLKLAVRGLNTAITPGQRQLAAATGGLSLEVSKLIADAIKQGKSTEEIGKMVREQAIRIGKQQNDLFNQIGEEGVAAMQSQGSSVVTAGAEFQKTYRTLKNVSEADIERQRKKQLADESNAKALAVAEQNIREFGNQITLLLGQILPPITGFLIQFGTGLLSAVSGFLKSDGFLATVKKVTDWFGETFNMLSKTSSFEEFMTVFTERAVDALKNIWNFLVPIWENNIKPQLEKFWDWAKPKMVEKWNQFVDWLRPYFIQLIDYLKKKISEIDVGNIVKTATIGTKVTSENQPAYEKQNQLNKSVMTASERVSTFFAEFFEGFTGTVLGMDDVAKRMAANRIEKDTAYGINDKRLNAGGLGSATPAPKRELGTAGMLGLLSEPKDAIVQVEKGERVLSPSETSAYNNNNNLVQALDNLNKLTAQVAYYMKETSVNTRLNVAATKNLNQNLFTI